MAKEEVKKEAKEEKMNRSALFFPPKLVGLLAEEVAKTVVRRIRRPENGGKKKKKNGKKIEFSIFLDTSAIIDGRIFDVASLGLFSGNFVILESILLELKHIADSQDAVKRERGRKGLEYLDKLKKTKGVRVIHLGDNEEKQFELDKIKEVDERLIKAAKINKGKVITCDFNLEKKANISGVVAININTLANVLKVIAVPGETLHIMLAHKGKDLTQGVGYLDDGTMIVVENASSEVGREVTVIVSRVIQTTAGRILFAKKI